MIIVVYLVAYVHEFLVIPQELHHQLSSPVHLAHTLPHQIYMMLHSVLHVLNGPTVWVVRLNPVETVHQGTTVLMVLELLSNSLARMVHITLIIVKLLKVNAWIVHKDTFVRRVVSILSIAQ